MLGHIILAITIFAIVFGVCLVIYGMHYIGWYKGNQAMEIEIERILKKRKKGIK
tara:strand:- start:323 stop:484 length:162 start_codon:yes stop_codon:yes gene_type:complete